MFSKKDENVVKSKLNDIVANLMFLSAEYGVQYTLNVAKFDETQHSIILGDTYPSENLDSAGAGLFLNNATSLYTQIDSFNALLASENIVVRCNNGENMPKDIGACPVGGKCYVVEEIIRTKDPNIFCYVLMGLKPNPPYKGYSSTRFTRVTAKLNSN